MQQHLDKINAMNLGSFYTPKFIVEIAYKILKKYVNLSEFLIFDNACGYGDFFIENLRYLGADIDNIALSKVRKNIDVLHTNSLLNISRQKFGIKENEKLIIIGNPPYNDKTSIINNATKQMLFEIDKELVCRDLGISFLRSYAILKPDFICVLHPLSYLIKKTNFNALKDFRKHYRLRDSVVISSQIFMPNSATFFPIIIALYEKNNNGMDFDFITHYTFTTYENKSLRLSDFDFITNYITKYPNPKDKRQEIAYFHTLRDINALKRNKTFLPTQTPNAIRVFSDNLKYYYYIHHFKQFASRLPYHFGNLDIFINHDKFLDIEDSFLDMHYNTKVQDYFDRLLKEYV